MSSVTCWGSNAKIGWQYSEWDSEFTKVLMCNIVLYTKLYVTQSDEKELIYSWKIHVFA